ncbi:MAG: twin-arginine translocation signal domain-containing protein, partial [Rhodospirillaceae bacterium]|nr:twin-arginine translocation signal domain-containing protein [Rhodospirillaceae bacterium]
MKRRDFLKNAATAGIAGAAATTLAAPAIAQNVRELKMVTTWPKNFPGLGTSAQRLADNITAISGGSLSVKVYAAGELVPPFESFDAVSNGTADMYHGAEYYWQGKSKAFNFFAAVPFGLTATEMNAWIHHGGGQ